MKKSFPALKFFNIPNAITSIGSVCGLFSLLCVLKSQLQLAVIFYAFAAICDGLDGMASRRFNQTSEIGGQLDSLSDFVNFVLLPVVFATAFVKESGAVIFFYAFYLICGMWRLGYYNIIGLIEDEKGKYFTGMPTTFCGGLIIIAIIFGKIFFPGYLYFLSLLFLIFGILMVCDIKIKKNGAISKFLLISGLISMVLVFFIK